MESEIDPGMAASMWGDAMTALNDWRGRAERAEAEVERLHSWDGLMGLLDERWPDDIFPTLPDDNRRDPGPRIVSLLRWLASEREAHAGLRARLEALLPTEEYEDAGVLVQPSKIRAALAPVAEEGGER